MPLCLEYYSSIVNLEISSINSIILLFVLAIPCPSTLYKNTEISLSISVVPKKLPGVRLGLYQI